MFALLNMMLTYIAIDIKYLIKLRGLRLSQSRCAAQEEQEKGRDGTRRHFEGKEATWAIERQIMNKKERVTV